MASSCGRRGRDDQGECGALAGALSSSTRPPWASAMARTIDRPSPAPSDAGGRRRRGGSGRRSARCSCGRDAGAAVGDPQPRLPVARARSRARSGRRARVCWTAFWASCMTACVSRWRSAVSRPAPLAGEPPVAVGERLRLGVELVGEDVEVERPGCRKSACSALASSSRSSTKRAIRSSSSVTRATVSSRSAGSSPSSSRWPRTIVIGVRSSWPASLDERALAGEGALQPVEHRVERAAEVGDLVVAVDVDAAGEVGLGDRLRRSCAACAAARARGRRSPRRAPRRSAARRATRRPRPGRPPGPRRAPGPRLTATTNSPRRRSRDLRRAPRGSGSSPSAVSTSPRVDAGRRGRAASRGRAAADPCAPDPSTGTGCAVDEREDLLALGRARCAAGTAAGGCAGDSIRIGATSLLRRRPRQRPRGRRGRGARGDDRERASRSTLGDIRRARSHARAR